MGLYDEVVEVPRRTMVAQQNVSKSIASAKKKLKKFLKNRV